jgi:HEAT repeat protein
MSLKTGIQPDHMLRQGEENTTMAGDVQAVMRDLDSRDWSVRMEAVRRLEMMRGEAAPAVPRLAQALADESQYVRAAAARALGKIGGADAVDRLIKALDDRAFHVRQNAVWALGEIGAPAEAALPMLEKFRQSKERFPQAELTVADLAGQAIGHIQTAVERSKAPAEAAPAAAQGDEGALTADERKAKREAALARKRAQAAGEAAAEAPLPAPAEAAAPGGGLTADERRAKREAALARKHAQQTGEGGES